MDQASSDDQVKKVIQELIEALGFVFASGAEDVFKRLPIERAAAIVEGIESHTMGLRCVVDFEASQKLRITYSIVEREKQTILFEVGDLTHNLGRPRLFAIKRSETESS